MTIILNHNLNIALSLAAQGYSVFPCHAGGEHAKSPMPFIKWRDVSTVDVNQIKKWWAKWPDAAIGLDVAKSDLLVIDCDRHSDEQSDGHNIVDGVKAFCDLCDEHGHHIDSSPLVATPNNGCHVYFKQTDKKRGNKRGGLPQGIDVRGHGGYVLAPGTIMQDGLEYELTGNLNSVPVLPKWLAMMLDEDDNQQVIQANPQPIQSQHDDVRIAAYCDAAIEQELNKLQNTIKGSRNNILNEVAFALGQLVGAGWVSESAIFNQLYHAALHIGLKGVEATKTIQSGLKAGINQPRSMPDNKYDQHDYIRQITVNGDGSAIDIETGEILEKIKPQKPIESFTAFPYPQGLVGDIAKWIVATARYPQPELAIGAALAIIGTFAGRQYAGPTRSGTHLYVLGLAPTGKGKDHALQQIMRIMTATQLPQHIGPSEFISMPAVINFLTRKPLSICAMDEFGDFMKRINSRRASGFENAISKVLRTLWSSSFAPFVTPEWASRPSETIYCPAITIYGASTPEQFYSAMEGSNLENGTLNRFLLINGRNNVVEIDPALDAANVPEKIIKGLKHIYERNGQLATAYRNDSMVDPTTNGQICMLNWCVDGAHECYKKFSRDVAKIMEQKSEAGAFYARSVEMALRIATIIAIGRMEDEQVRLSDMEYGIMVAKQSAEFMETGAADYMSSNENQANAQRIIRILKSRGGRMEYRDLSRSLQNSIRSRDLKELLQSMCESEQLERQEVKPKRGPSSFWYELKKQ